MPDKLSADFLHTHHDQIVRDVLKLLADRFGESPTERPSGARRVLQCQLALMFLGEACDHDPKAIMDLVGTLLQVPSKEFDPSDA